VRYGFTQSIPGLNPWWDYIPCNRTRPQVVQRIGSVSYKLELLPKAQIHDVFHISLLKKFEGPPSSMVTLPAIHHGLVLPTLENIVKARLN
jgi:hypothetical protein